MDCKRSIIATIALLFGGLLLAGAAQADITGTAFRDFNADGSLGAFEPGIGGLVVQAYDGTGTAVGNSPQTTAPDGSFTLTGLPPNALRIEVTLPTDNSLDFLQQGAAGLTTTTFAADGDNIDIGFNNPAQFCQTNPNVAVNCFVNGDLLAGSGSGNDALVTIPYNGFAMTGDFDAPSNPVQLAIASQIGTAWGLAYQRRSQTIFSSAAHKRHSSFGPSGPGAIYRIDLVGGAVSLFLDINDTGGMFSAGADVHAGLGNLGDPSTDPASFDAAGKTSLGDLAISEDDQTLWLVNVEQRTLLEIPIGLPATAPAAADIVEHSIPTNQCTNGEFRPWAVEFHDGQVYVGGVCSGENSGTQADLFAFVYRHDPAGAVSSFTEIFSFPIGYDRGCAMEFVAPFIGCDGFEPWKPDWFDDSSGTLGNPPDGPVQPPDPNLWAAPQALMTDIEIDSDGSLLLAFADRFNLQAAYENFDTVNSGPGAPTYSGVGAGETVRVCNVGGSFVLEGNAACNGTGVNGDGPGTLGQEFYHADDAPIGSNIHREGTLGAVSVLHGSGEVLTTITDPVRVWSGGMVWFDGDEGDQSAVFADGSPIPGGAVRRYEVFIGQFSPGETGNGKNGGLGDSEILCDPAPIEIGNRVWCDAPGALDTPDGIQDAVGGTGVVDTDLPGVVVDLSCNGGAVTATTTTGAGGVYLFNTANVSGGIPPAATCTVSIDTGSATNIAALGTCNNLAPANVGMPADPGQDLRDSDGTDAGMTGTVSATVTIGSPGANDHNLDFGFSGVVAPMPMLTAIKADAVLVDGDMDTMLDAGDTLRYTVTVTNSGTADATLATYSSNVDANTTLVVGSVTTSQGAVTTGNTGGDTAVAIDLGTIAMGGGSVSITYDVTLNAPVPIGVSEISCQGNLVASNHPMTMTDDPDDPMSSTDPTNTPVDAAPEVTATKVDSLQTDGDMDGLVDAGDTVRYTVVVSNSGDQDAGSVMLTSSVDANTSLVVGSVTTTQGTVTTGNTGGDTSVAVDIGTVANSGGTVTITYDVTVDSPIPVGVTQIACQATVNGSNVPSTPTDDPDDPTTDDPTNTPLDLGSDFGDAPDSYTTTVSPSHALDAAAGVYLGACVDSEAAGQPAAMFGDPADGDDTNDLGAPMATLGTCAASDDEDGVTFDTMIVACSTANGVTVTSAGMGRLDGWIDFNGDGDFADAGEQIFTNQALTGSDTLTFTAPCTTESGTTYARLRVSSLGGLGSSGAAANGEVEDYLVTTKGIDLGDAPDSYDTMDPATAAVHPVNPTTALYLGTCVDTEAAGQPNATASGDDSGAGLSTVGACAAANDDEEGVTFDTMVVACSTTNQVTVTSVGTGAMLDGWIDFNDDGDFADGGEQIFTSQALTGSDALMFTAPCTAQSATTYARFRVSSTGGLGPAGAAMDGEVEDYEVTTKGLDFGDAPDSYTTTASPSHVVDPATQLFLGACVDTEAMGQPNATASLDDTVVGLSTVGTCAGNDDEDGVTFDTMIVACSTSQVTVTSVGTGALLDGWIDFNGDGDFADAGEQIYTSQALTGSDTLNYSTPCDAESGDTFARFRVSTAGGLSFDGAAMSGEVEDYLVTTKGLDYGDAPDTYGTSDGAGGASHAVDPGTPLYLGACVDTEADGQPVTAGNPANGDDLGAGLSTVGTCVTGDEDGVAFDTMIIACGTADVTMTASQAGMVDGWIDFNGDGDFADAGEQIFVAQPLLAGANTESFAVPCGTATNQVTYARFRLSTVGGLGTAGGPALNGEVEDYSVTTKGVDYGDAPDSYSTSQSTNGPSHAVDPGAPLFLGACVDTEADGQPVTAGNPADGDDLGAGISDLGGCAGNDDEDGVTFDDMVVACGTSNVTVTASQSGLLDAWIDFNGDGDFADPGEQILASQTLAAGANSVPYAVSCSTVTNAVSYARFRLSSAGGLLPGGLAMDGEVEDYEVATKGLDFGDAPEADGYPTLIASDGARHVVQPLGNPSLAGGPDTEPDGQPTASHLGDDQNGSPDDEDGVSMPGVFVPGGAPMEVTLTAGPTGGLVNAWIDWNRDGDWDDAGEQVATNVAIAAGASEIISISAPAGASEGMSCSRFRIDSAGGLSPTGLAMDGEVEDYSIAIGVETPVLGISQELISVQDLGDNDHSVMLEINIENIGNVELGMIDAMTDLADCFADAEDFVVSLVDSTAFTLNGGFDGLDDLTLLDGTDLLAIGESGTLLLQVVVSPGSNAGPYYCSVAGTAISPGGTEVTDISQDGGEVDPDDNGDPTDNDEPTEIEFGILVIEIPTLGQWSLGLLALLLAAMALRAVNGRRLG